MRILTSESMSITDNRTMKELNIDDKYLVCKASEACFKIIKEYINNKTKILVVCGNSNNSSDGFKLASILRENEYNVDVLYSLDKSKMNTTCRYFYDQYKTKYEVLEDINVIDNYDVLIDAIIGNGLKGDLRDEVNTIVEKINDSKAYIISIDYPTGLNSNGTYSNCIKANLTICINNIKLSHLINDGVDMCGDIKIANIDLKQYDDLEHLDTINLDEYKDYFVRKKNSNKYDYGNILVIGSNVSMPGAGIMASLSALKSGAGLVTLACPKENLDIVSTKAPYEIMVKSLDDEDILNKKDTVIFGPGLKNDDRYLPLLEKLLSLNINLIVDADGLGLLSKINSINMKCANLVITPHIGEAARLLHKTSSEIKNDIFGSFKELIDVYDCMVVLKGHNTLVGDKNNYYISLSGNSGMATAGSGDVLSGIIAGVSKKELNLKSVLLGVYIHGLAGDIACKEFNETSLTATDIINNIYKAINVIKGEGK